VFFSGHWWNVRGIDFDVSVEGIESEGFVFTRCMMKNGFKKSPAVINRFAYG
jgi:hypothetical protein